jgi:hypothetical protein
VHPGEQWRGSNGNKYPRWRVRILHAVQASSRTLTKDFRKKTTQLRTDGATSVRASVGALWGPKQLENLVGLNLSFKVVPEKVVLRRREEGSVGNQ